MGYSIQYFSTVAREFRTLDLGDKRLNRRVVRMAEAMDARPWESLPKQLQRRSELDASYRLLGNEKVQSGSLLQPHINETIHRANLESVVLAIHDTTEFKFSTDREGLGWVRKQSNKSQGFWAHLSLLASVKNRPLGIAAVELSVQTGKKKGYLSPAKRNADPTRKSLRWMRGVEQVERLISTGVIHIADREADFYEYFSALHEKRYRHITRVSRDRLVEEGTHLYEKLQTCQVVLNREVPLSRRGKNPLPSSAKVHPARKHRVAALSVRATQVALQRPHHSETQLTSAIVLNVVHVFEENPPPGEPAVDWKLLTTEPIDFSEQVASIIDFYTARWLIEEFNKALKSGCGFEQRQLESSHTIFNALSIFIPIAWRLLLLRSESRLRPNEPAILALTQNQITILKALSNLSADSPLTLKQALLEVAYLGGYIKYSPRPPGWQTLKKGLTELLTLEKGWNAAKTYG